MQAAVLEHDAGMVAQGEQQLVVQLFEPARPVRADDNTVEVIRDVDRDPDEVLDLVVAFGRGAADHLWALERAIGKALRDSVRGGVTVEAAARDEVEVAIPVAVLL